MIRVEHSAQIKSDIVPSQLPDAGCALTSSVGSVTRRVASTALLAARSILARTSPLRGQLRIIAGRWRGRRLVISDTRELRPTPDRVRETLFNWLAPVLPGARCLDLFAGTGALALEAASRGAARVVAVERDAVIARQLRASVEALAGEDIVEVHHGDALDYLAGDCAGFDVVFVDPPYSADLHTPILQALNRVEWLRDEGELYIESAANDEEPEPGELWNRRRTGTAGQVRYSLWNRR
jgi:16S rRNA (guanine966-N2)-methyltransferase